MDGVQLAESLKETKLVQNSKETPLLESQP
jgi:hypothetical protein